MVRYFSHNVLSTYDDRHRLSAATVMAMTFGYEYPPGRKEDRFVKLAEDTAAGVTSLFLPESTIINIFPFLRHIPPWVPGATTQKVAADIRETFKGFKNEPFEYLKREVVSIFAVLPGSQAYVWETFRQLERRNHLCWQASSSEFPRRCNMMMKYSRTHFQPITLVCHSFERRQPSADVRPKPVWKQ